MIKPMMLGVILVLVGAISTWVFFPKRVVVERHIPEIVVQVDTVEFVPRAVRDSLKALARRKVTTDTFQLVTERIVVESVFIDRENPPNLWLPMYLTLGQKDGEESEIASTNLRSGQLVVSRLWTPGPLVSLSADSLPLPKLSFGSWPIPERGSNWADKLLWAGVGFSGCAVYSLVAK